MGASKLPKKILARQQEITAAFLLHVDQHLDDILSGKAADMFEIRDFAALQFIHPTHLSNTIKLSTGKSPCDFMEAKIMDISRTMDYGLWTIDYSFFTNTTLHLSAL